MDSTPYSELPVPDLGDVDNVPSWISQLGVALDLKVVLTADSRADMATRFPAGDLGSTAALCIIGSAHEIWMHAPNASTWTAMVVPPESWKNVPLRSGYRSGFQTLQYRRYWAAPGLWVVGLRGTVTGNDGDLNTNDAGAYVGDMPIGYRPPILTSPNGIAPGPNGGPPHLDIEPNGAIQFVAGDTTLPIGQCAVYTSYEVDVSVDDLQ